MPSLVHLALPAAVMAATSACAPAPPLATKPSPIAVASAPPQSTSVAPPTAAPSYSGPFHIVAVTSFVDRLMAFDDVPIAVATYDSRFMPLVAGQAPVLHERHFTGLPGPYNIRGVGGLLEGAGAVATDFDPFVAGGGAGLYRRAKGGDRWLPQPFQGSFEYVGSGKWHGGRYLALSVASGYGRMAPYFRYEVISGPTAPTPEPQLVDDAPGLGGPQRGLAVYPEHVIVRASGEVLAIGAHRAGNGASSGLYVERFAPPKLASTIEALPKPADELGCDVAGWADAGATVWLTCSTDPEVRRTNQGGFMLTYRDETWLRAQLPAAASIPRKSLGMSAAPDGTVWLAAGGLLRLSDGAWREVELPKYQGKPLQAIAVLADAPDSVWVVGRAERSAVVLHTRPIARSKPPVWHLLDSRAECTYPSLSLRERKPGSDRCLELFVLLREFDEPQFEPAAVQDIVQALRGYAARPARDKPRTDCMLYTPSNDRIRLVRSVEGSRSFFGARVPAMEMADRVVEMVSAALPKTSPQTLCYRPDADAELVVDLATSSITGWADPVLPPLVPGPRFP